MSATYTYGARGELQPVKLTWYQGQMKPKQFTEGKIPAWRSGVLFVGDKGMLLSDYGKHVLLPEERSKDFKRPEPFLPDSKGHHQEWIQACKTGEPTTCNVLYSGPLTIANHLGNVAYRIGKKIEWGYSIPYAITGMLDEHPKPAIEYHKNSNNAMNYRDFYESLKGKDLD